MWKNTFDIDINVSLTHKVGIDKNETFLKRLLRNGKWTRKPSSNNNDGIMTH